MATNFKLNVDVSFALLEMVEDTNRSIRARENIAGPDQPYSKRLGSGTGAGNINIGWLRATPTALAAGADADFDFSGALTDSSGTTLIAATKLVALIIVNYSLTGTLGLRGASATSVPLFTLVGGNSTQPGIVIPVANAADDPSFVLWFANSGLTIAGGSTDKLNLINNGASGADYRIGFAARSA